MPYLETCDELADAMADLLGVYGAHDETTRIDPPSRVDERTVEVRRRSTIWDDARCTVACGEEAIEIVQDAPIHLALLDMHMPTLTGLETLEIVRQINAVLPCILVTADATEGLMRQAFHARAFSVIPKPVSKHVVLYTVVRALVRVYGRGEEEARPEKSA